LLTRSFSLNRVAFGIMTGFAFNLLFSLAPSDETTFSLIQGAPTVPALALLVAVWYCPESPRYLLRPPRPRIQEAYSVFLKLRNTEVGEHSPTLSPL
jgi:hypothetical protein